MNTSIMRHVNIPLSLTLIRLIIAPLTLPFLLVYLLPLNIFSVNISLGILFVLFSITDFFDGYFARRYGQVTQLGAMLDPIADKFLLLATLISLLVVQKIYFLWVLILISREFFVTSLRALAAEHGFNVSVISLGKIKTAFQMIYMTLLIILPCNVHYEGYTFVRWFETALLVGTLFFSIVSAYRYYNVFMQNYGKSLKKIN